MKNFFNLEDMKVQSATLWAIIVVTVLGTLAYADIRTQIKELQRDSTATFTRMDYGIAAYLHNSSPDKRLPTLEDIRRVQNR